TPTAAAEQAVPSLEDLYGEQVQYLQRIGQVVSRRLRLAQDAVLSLQTRLHRLRLDRQLAQQQQTIDWQRQKLIASLTQRLQLAQHQHQLLAEKLSTLDPEAVLKRGYALVKADGAIATSAKALSIGSELDIQLSKGQLKATVTEVESGK
ncbi:MAG: exodeoxyribonuclease VII large subunit, partial [Cyanobacteria bacterium J06649_5]